MSTEIRASAALAATAAQSSQADLSFQNQLFSVSPQNQFTDVLERQLTAREDIRQSQAADAADRQRDAANDRQAAEARRRQQSGKPLPDRHERPSAQRSEDKPDHKTRDLSRTDDPRSTDSTRPNARADHQSSSEAIDKPACETQTQAPAQTQTAPVTASNGAETVAEPAPDMNPVESDAAVAEQLLQSQQNGKANTQQRIMEEQQSTAGSAAQDLAEQSLASDEALNLQALTGATAASDLAATGVSNVAMQQKAVDEVSANAGELADKELQQDSTTPVDATAPEITNVQTTAELIPVPVAALPRSVPATSARDKGQASTASGGQATTLAGQNALTASTVQHQQVQKSADGNTGEGDLDAWKLGPDQTPAEKNLELKADAAKLAGSAPDKSAVVKEQLFALAQQVAASDKPAATRTSARQVEGASDVKGASFSRNLEQLTNSRTDTGKPVSTGIQTPVYSKEWPGELGQRLMMMVSSKIKSAEIHLNPKDLGPMEVRIRMHEDKAHVVFSSQLPQTRDALEQAVPKLREMLEQNGVGLGNVDVNDHGAQQSQQRDQGEQQERGRSANGGEIAGADSQSERVVVRALGLVDYYA